MSASLYVYYRVNDDSRAQRLRQWRALAAALAAHQPRRQCRRDDADTWMEIYPDVSSDFAPAYHAVLAALDPDGDWRASRHEEWFIDTDDSPAVPG